ncbi:related to CYC8-general repressor of transcription [Rhynchosporium agropyri]|uniref:Related to CYC8-general repressor of transcription n=1 Tax=Rhynchosporium agropyri TaxID=914238 RepID=A0A1E1K6S4_9HELO|nr:related to CYC8-general repressor of transcription [Rhynchosporium agropyri]
MSYQGGPAPGNGNGYWAGHGPPNTHNTHDPRPQQTATNGSQSQHAASFNQTHGYQAGQRQHWNQHGQEQYSNPNYLNNNTSYATNNNAPYAPPAVQQQYQTASQFISPAQLLQQQPPAQTRLPQSYQRDLTPSMGRSILNPVYANSPRPTAPADPSHNMAMLLVSLAEEYFESAHSLAPSVLSSMTDGDVHAYEKLVATGLGCLETALKNLKLPPRLEANIRLRYAGVLFEETENHMEGETALSQGIALCERNHYYDLKYAMQFLLAKFMAKKNPKASMKALEGHISESEVYQHYPWVYAFRLLRASHSFVSGIATENHAAIVNLNAVTDLAEQLGDHAVHLTASLMKAIAYMKRSGTEAMENIQASIAAAWRYQTEPSCRIPQLVALTHILAVACSIRQGNSKAMVEDLKKMQMMMDDALKNGNWSTSSDTMSIPIQRTLKSSQIVSSDTRTVLGIGGDGGDNLMICFLNKKDTYAITYLLSGVVLLHKNSADQKGLKFLKAGLDLLEADTKSSKKLPGLLPELITQRRWRGQLLCYLRVYMAFCSAGLADWSETKRQIDALMATSRSFDIAPTGPLEILAMYLTGVYHQGIGDLDRALNIFQDAKFALPTAKNLITTSMDQLYRDISLFAALNTLWILHENDRQDVNQNTALIEKLRPFCEHHPSVDLQTAFNLVWATVPTNPPVQMYQVKNHLRAALNGASATANTQFLCITLNVMCSRFFSNVVGDQAEKSAMAASTQATNSGNVLWRSVADGMLAQCYEVQGKKDLAQETLQQAQYFARKAALGSGPS